MDREKWKGFDDTSFREDIRSLLQHVTNLERDLHDIQKSTAQPNTIPHKLSPNPINATRLFSGK